jgi:hypothetical protein
MIKAMHESHVQKNDQWQIESFKGLAINELFAKEYISARIKNDLTSANKVMKGIRVIHNS